MNTRIRTVTHPVDFPDHAVAWALDLANAHYAKLRQLHSLEAVGNNLPRPEDVWLWLGAPCSAGDTSGPSGALEQLELAKCLSPTELERTKRFPFAEDRWSYAAAHAGLRALLGQVVGDRPEKIRFRTLPKGKLALCDSHYPANLAASLHFNVSHTRGLVAVAISGSPVGVDVERVRILPDMRQIVFDLMAPEALAAFRRAQSVWERVELFFRFWTLGEAFIKATGEGVHQGLETFAFTEDGSPSLTRVTPGWGGTKRWRFGHARFAAVDRFSHAA
jgi:4'-phosphopantetheinyl transferase